MNKKSKMRVLIIMLLCFIYLKSNGQNIFKGTISDGVSKKTLPYVNIGIIGKNIGTVSDFNGDFQIELNEKFERDTLKISMIGYLPQLFEVANFKTRIQESPNIQLEQDIVELQEVVISSKMLKQSTLGNKTTSHLVTGGFASNDLGNEIGILIKIKKSPTYINNFSVSIVKNNYDKLKFRLNFYDLKDGLPHGRISKENIIINSDIKEGILTVDLTEYNLVVYEDFFVSLEWIENLGESNGLTFSSGFLGSPIMIRKTSQGNWKKIKGLSVGFHLMANY